MPGDPPKEAIERLIHLEGQRIYSLARRFCGNETDAVDLVQQTFLEAFRSWPTFRGDAKPSTWLYRIAARACTKLQRKYHDPMAVHAADVIPEAFRNGPVPDIGVSEDTPLMEQVRKETIDELHGAIVELPFEYRAPLVLKEIVGFSVHEVAEVLGLSEGAVKTRLHRARLKLVEALARSGPVRQVPPPRFDAQVCLELLEAKQHALDRGVRFELPPEQYCERCEAVFRSMDLAAGICKEISEEGVPPGLVDALRRRVGQMDFD